MFSGSSLDPSGEILNSVSELGRRLAVSFASNFDPKVIADKMIEVDDAAVNIAKSFGQGRENVLGLSRAMAGAVREVTLLGGNFQKIAEIQEGVSGALGRNVILMSESYEKLFAAQEVSGRSARDIVSSFKDVGFSLNQSSTQMEKVINTARQIGANAQAVSGVVLDNMNALNRFTFDGGVQGLARMAAQATTLRINMKETLDFAEKVFDPEGAIEVAAAMQRLGVANSELLDPLRLMDMAQNDPAELQDQLTRMTSQFVQLNKEGQFEIMPGAKRQLREISNALNIPYETLTKMAIGTKELDEKLKQISFGGFSFTEDQERMIANLAEMGDDGQFKITMDGKSLNLDDAMTKLAGMGKEEREKFFESTQPKTVEELAKEQLDVLTSINSNISALGVSLPYSFAGTEMGKDAITAPETITREIASLFDVEVLSIKNITEGIDIASTKLFDSLNGVITGEESIESVLNTMSDVGTQLTTNLETIFNETSDQYVKSVDRLTNSNNMWINLLMTAGNKLKDVFLNNENLGNGAGTQSINVEDFIIKPLPQDSIKIVGGTNLDGNNNQQMVNTNNTPIDINLKMDINAPPNIDTAQLVLALQNTGVREAIVTAVNRARTNDNQTTTTPNPQRQMVRTNNAMGLTGIPNV